MIQPTPDGRPVPPPSDALTALLPADLAGDPTSLRHPEVVDLLNGMVWSRLGNGPQAWLWWDRVREPGLQPWVAAERGRVVRELGLHDIAEEFDEQALAEAQAPIDMVRARIGLVADAVGQGDGEVAALRLEAVDGLLDRIPDGPATARQRLRRRWVAIEVALANGEPAPVDGLPDWGEADVVWPADSDHAHGTDFHRAKSLLFAGVARGEPRLLDAAALLAPPVLLWAVHLARADAGVEDALRLARQAWSQITPPNPYAEAARATPTAQRLSLKRRH